MVKLASRARRANLARIPEVWYIRGMKYTRETLAPVVAVSKTYREVAERFGKSPLTGLQHYLSLKIKEFGIDTSHFGGPGWSLGLKATTDSRVARRHLRKDGREVFQVGRSVGGRLLRDRLIEGGREYKCSQCGCAEWNGRPLTLHVDHVNGNKKDCRKRNLRFLCPNCHQQTRTWGARKNLSEHGTRSRFVYGCKCELCTLAARAYDKARRERVKASMVELVDT